MAMHALLGAKGIRIPTEVIYELIDRARHLIGEHQVPPELESKSRFLILACPRCAGENPCLLDFSECSGSDTSARTPPNSAANVSRPGFAIRAIRQEEEPREEHTALHPGRSS